MDENQNQNLQTPQPTQQPQTPNTPHSHPKRWLVGILIALGVIAVAITLALLLDRNRVEEQPQENADQTQTETDPYAGWETYRNEEFGYEIKHPSNFVVIRDFGEEGLFRDFEFAVNTKLSDNILCFQASGLAHEGSPCTLSISIYDSLNKNLQDIVNENEDLLSISIFEGLNEEIKIGRQTWIIAGTPEGPGIGSWHLYTLYPDKDKYAVLNVTNVFDIDTYTIKQFALDIISTFKFIESVDTTSWQTYRNEEFGFEFMYPGDWRFEADTEGVLLNSPQNEAEIKEGCLEGCPIDIIIAFDNNPNHLPAREYYDGDPGITAFDNPALDKQIKIDGKNAFQLYPTTGILPGELVIIPLPEIFIRFDVKIDTTNNSTFDQILSTFKFVE